MEDAHVVPEEDDLCRTVRTRATRLIPLLASTADDYTRAHIAHSQAMVVLNEGQLISAHLSAHIAELTSTLAALDQGVFACRSAVAPINRLPLELLGEIFACAAQCAHGTSSVTDVRGGPWLVSHVCRRWRALALGTPALWTTVDVGDHAFSRRLGPKLVSAYVKRSGDALVSCSLSVAPSQPVPVVHVFLGILFRCRGRWQHAYFALDAACLDHLAPPSNPGFPALEHIDIHLTGKPDSGGGPPKGCNLFAESPRLRRALVSGAQHRAFRFAWSQLEYYVGHVVTEDGRCILPELGALQRCGPSVHAARPIPKPATPYVLPALAKLCVNHGTVVDAITTPALAECAFGSGPCLAQVCALLERSICSLRALRLIDNPIPLDGMRRLLQLCPDLRELAIGCMLRVEVDVYALLDALTIRSGGTSPLVPVLEQLAFSPFYRSFDCSPLVELARSRAPAAGGRLLSVSLLLSQCTLDGANLYDALRQDAASLGFRDVCLTDDFSVSDDIVNSWLDV